MSKQSDVFDACTRAELLDVIDDYQRDIKVMDDTIKRLEARCAHLHKALRRTTRELLDLLGNDDCDKSERMCGSKEHERGQILSQRAADRWDRAETLRCRDRRGWGKCPSVERMEQDGKAQG